jgi:hypothetical protein
MSDVRSSIPVVASGLCSESSSRRRVQAHRGSSWAISSSTALAHLGLSDCASLPAVLSQWSLAASSWAASSNICEGAKPGLASALGSSAAQAHGPGFGSPRGCQTSSAAHLHIEEETHPSSSRRLPLLFGCAPGGRNGGGCCHSAFAAVDGLRRTKVKQKMLQNSALSASSQEKGGLAKASGVAFFSDQVPIKTPLLLPPSPTSQAS